MTLQQVNVMIDAKHRAI